MSRQIPTVVVCITVLFLVGCHYDTLEAKKQQEEFRHRLRDIAVEVVESEKCFFGSDDQKNALLESIHAQNPRYGPSVTYVGADAAMPEWTAIFGNEDTKEGFVSIEFELLSRNREAKMGIGIVRLAIRNEQSPKGERRTRIRTLSPHQVKEVEYLHSEDGKITPIKETREERDTILLKD